MTQRNEIVRSADEGASPVKGQSADDSERLLFNPPIDIYETGEGLVLYADLPGVNADTFYTSFICYILERF